MPPSKPFRFPRLLAAHDCQKRSLAAVLMLALLAGSHAIAFGQSRNSATAPDPADFAKLEPFIVKGEALSITVYARSGSDRRYAERLAESVVEVAYETMEKSTGHGLVIVGEDDDPHPLFVFRRFLALEQENRLPTELGGAVAELRALLQEWQDKVKIGDASENEMDIDFESIVKALPLPLEGVATQLYLVAWAEEFADARVDERLLALKATDLNAKELAKYDWVFYLPPRNAFKAVLQEVVPKLMKEAELGFFKRMAIQGTLFTFKPAIKDAFESLRKGMLYFTVLRARSSYSEGDIEELTEAYIEALMPKGKVIPGQKKDRAIAAIEAQKIENAEYAKNPFVSPDPLENPDLRLYSKFEGEYGYEKNKTTHRFSIKDGTCYWQYLDWDPGVFHPAGDALFVSDKGDMTIEFVSNDDGAITGVEERWERRRNTIPRKLN